jgi:hypothetical protein
MGRIKYIFETFSEQKIRQHGQESTAWVLQVFHKGIQIFNRYVWFRVYTTWNEGWMAYSIAFISGEPQGCQPSGQPWYQSRASHWVKGEDGIRAAEELLALASWMDSSCDVRKVTPKVTYFFVTRYSLRLQWRIKSSQGYFKYEICYSTFQSFN